MAITRVNVGTRAKVASGNMTPGAPASIQAGDILLCFAMQRDNVVSTMSADWTQAYGVNNGASARASCWWYRYTGAAPSYVITRTAGDTGIAFIVAYRGCESVGSPIDNYGTQNSSSSQAITAPSVATTQAYDKILFVAHAADNGTNGVFSGTNPTPVEFVDDNTSSGSDAGIAADDGDKTDIGSTSARTSTYSLAQYHIGATVALKANRHLSLSGGLTTSGWNSREDTGAQWYNPNGDIATSRIYAYRAVGRGSKADSLVNEAQPGDHNLTEAGTVGWDSTNGWSSSGSSNHLDTGLTPAAGWSMLVQFSGLTAGASVFIAGEWDGGAGGSFQVYLRSSTDVVRYNDGGGLEVSPRLLNGNLGIGGQKSYRNGTQETGTIPSWSASAADDIQLLARPDGEWIQSGACIRAVAIYKPDGSGNALAAAQFAAIADAMADLPTLPGATYQRTFLAHTAGLVGSAAGVKQGGGQQFQQAVSGALTFIGNQLDRLTRTLSSGQTFSGAELDKLARKLAGGQTFSGAELDKLFRALTGGETFVGGFSRRAGRAFVGDLTTAGTVLNRVGRGLTGALVFAGAQIDQVRRLLQAKLGISGVADGIKLALKTLSGGLSTAGGLPRRSYKAFDGAVTFAGAQIDKIYRTLAGSLGSAASLVSQKFAGLKYQTVYGAQTFAGTLAKQGKKGLTGAIAFLGGLVDRLDRTLTGAIDPTGAWSGVRAVLKALTGGLSFAGGQLNRVGKAIAGAFSSTGSAKRAIGKAVAGATSFFGATGHKIPAFVQGVLNFLGSLASFLPRRSIALAGTYHAYCVMEGTLTTSTEVDSDYVAQVDLAGAATTSTELAGAFTAFIDLTGDYTAVIELAGVLE